MSHLITVPDNPSFPDFCAATWSFYNDMKDKLRWGQCAFEVLHAYRPDISMKVLNTKFDPFFTDHRERMEDFFEYVHGNW